jgi:hypothetical protein
LAGRAEARRDRQGDRVLRNLDHVVNSAAFSRDGSRIVTAEEDNRASSVEVGERPAGGGLRKAETPPIALFSPHSPDDAAEIIENDRVSEKT